ncbi:uncharacterized protein LOC127852977 isoform X1 [Dreissena polymorpha]|nr:uncharacterized protein LOC127852977 isoform X1 [Dreissena polymorpha]
MSTLFAEIDQRTVYSRRLRDKDSYTPTQVVEELAIPMVNKLLEELDSGFNFVSPELKAFSVFTLTNLPETIVELRESDYGKAKIETLTSHYGLRKEDTYKGQTLQSPPLFDKATALAEFDGFKYVMFMHRNSNPPVDLLQKMLGDEHLRTTYPCMYQLLLLSRLVPSSTASVERVFSLMNNLCTTNRNCFSQETLTALIMLCREGCEQLSDVQTSQTVEIFKKMKERDISL